VRYARWNIGQDSALFQDAGRYTTWALGGRPALSFFMVGSNELHAGQPYENTSITSTLPAGTLVRWAGEMTL